MRIILVYFISIVTIFALSLKINSGKYEKQPYSVLHLEHSIPFQCTPHKTAREKVYEYVCNVENVALNRFATSQNDFFIISSTTKGGKFSVKIESKADMILYPIEYDLKDKPSIEWHKGVKSKHWIAVGFVTKLPIITDKKEPKGISFPVEITGKAKPYIGALDLDKKPLHFESSEDVKTFLDVKQIYEDEKYEDAIMLIDEYLSKNPNSIFESDFILYKIKSLGDMGGEENAEQNGKLTEDWIKSYPSNENLPEVLVYAGLALERMRQEDQAKRYFNTVIDQHSKSKFASLAKVYLGDIFYHDTAVANGEAVADRLYREALYATNDIEIASMAAMRLGEINASGDDIKRANEYYRKVLEANKEYMLKDPKKAYALTKKLRLKKAYLLAADIGAALVDKLHRGHEIYESLLNDTATWYAMGKNVPKAIKYYQLYLKTYPNSDYTNSVKRELDLLVFEENNKSNEEKMKKYDYLIEEYKDQDIAMKALYHKVLLLKDMKKYRDALALEDELLRIPEDEAPNKNEIIKDIATELTKESLDKECFLSVELIKKYDVKLNEDYDKKVYKCYYQSFSYQDAIDIGKKYLKSSDLDTKLLWLYNTEKALFKKGDYNQVLAIAKDILALSDTLKTSDYNDVYYDLFEVYSRVNDFDTLVDLLGKIEKNFPMKLENIKVYKKIILLAQTRRDSFMVIDYARKLMEIQKRYNISQESPWIESVAIDTYLSLDRLEQALSVSKEAIENPKINDSDKAKILYSQAKIYQKMGNIPKQKESLQECSNINAMSSWVNLCKEALKWSD
jgi:tetratricopeptide (TPR) repeat protein